MSDITLKKKVNIFAAGFLVSLLFVLLIYVFMGQLLLDFVIGDLNTNLTLFLIIMLLFILTLLVSIAVGFIVLRDIKSKTVYKASILSIPCLILILIILSYGTLLALEPTVFSQVEWYAMLIIFPQVLIYFGIYVLHSIFMLFIIMIIVYYIFFVFWIEVFFDGYNDSHLNIRREYLW